MCLYAFLPCALCFLLTTLPVELRTNDALVRPLAVLTLRPAKTADFAREPLAMVDTRLAFFIAFITFIAFIAFIAQPDMRKLWSQLPAQLQLITASAVGGGVNA